MREAGIGLMEDNLQVPVEILEDHRMTSIFLEYGFVVTSPRPGELSGSGAGEGDTVLTILEGRPEDQKFPPVAQAA